MRYMVAFLSGLVFALGLGLSRMTQPQKVLGFLDVFGTWDPTLAFVMFGAVGVHGLLYLFIQKRSRPILDDQFHTPGRTDTPLRLFAGSVLFGAGWGLAGYCPGPGLVSLFSGHQNSFLFVAFMLVGMLFYKLTKSFFTE